MHLTDEEFGYLIGSLVIAKGSLEKAGHFDEYAETHDKVWRNCLKLKHNPTTETLLKESQDG